MRLVRLMLLLGAVARVMAADAQPRSLAMWQSQMTTFGKARGAELQAWLATHDWATVMADPTTQSIGDALIMVYYDRMRVMYQIADYTGQAEPWTTYARDARKIYRDGYVLKFCKTRNAWACVPGYEVFTLGLRMDFERTGDPLSKEAVIRLSQGGAYCNDKTEPAVTIPAALGREVAYCIAAIIDAEKLGEPRRARRQVLVDHAYGHLKQFTDKTWQGTNAQISPFGIALTAEALIRDWADTNDGRLVPALKAAADLMWTLGWQANTSNMRYDINPGSPTYRSYVDGPDLNNLLSPLYAWLYAQTGNTTDRDRADALFAGAAVRGGNYLYLGKQFNQAFRWSPDYVKWRGGTVTPSSPRS